MTEIPQLLEAAQEAALQAGKAIMEIFRSDKTATELKEGGFPVTPADQRSYTIISTLLGKTGLPVLSEEAGSIDFKERKRWEYFWLVDPLDGTEEFIHKREEFTINVALIRKHSPAGGVIYAPATDTLYIGSKETGVCKKGKEKPVFFLPLPERKQFKAVKQKEPVLITVSRSHRSKETMDFIKQFPYATILAKGSSLKFMLLLESEADLYPRLEPTMEWDTAAAHAILNASGRGVYHIDLHSELVYNKADLQNPFFVAF